MTFVFKFFEADFVGKSSKEAYMSACRFYAEHVISKVEVGETFMKVEKVDDAHFPTYKLSLYASFDESSFVSSFCNSCKEFHRSFYINQEYNCSACRMQAFRNTLKEKMLIKRGFRREVIKHVIKKVEQKKETEAMKKAMRGEE